jgi:hypothetical protein
MDVVRLRAKTVDVGEVSKYYPNERKNVNETFILPREEYILSSLSGRRAKMDWRC